jgi:hypothetical protein
MRAVLDVRDGVRAVRRALHVDVREAVDGDVRGHEHVVGRDASVLGLDDALVDLRGERVLEDLRAGGDGVPRQRGEVLARVELGLVRPEHGAAGLERQRYVIDVLRLEARLARGGGLALQLRDVLALFRVEVARHALEMTVDRVALHQLGDLFHRGVAGVGDELRLLFTVMALDVVVARVDGLGDVGGGVAGLAAGDGLLLDDGHAAPFLGEKEGGGDAGDSRADDDDVDMKISTEGFVGRRTCSGFPEGR